MRQGATQRNAASLVMNPSDPAPSERLSSFNRAACYRYDMRRNEFLSELQRLVDTSAPESALQEILQRHPSAITDTRGVSPALVLTQLPLGSEFVADFAYFWWQSNGSFVTLVEIEAPDTPVFNAKNEFAAPFNHAVQQLSDWEEWLRRNPDAIDVFSEPLFDMGLTTGGLSYSQVQTRLIAGRRSDVRANARRRMRWEQRANELGRRQIRTWDGFLEEISRPAGMSWWGSVKTARYQGGMFVEVATEETA